MSPAHCFERAPAPGCAEDCGEAFGAMPSRASRAPTGRLGCQLTDTLVALATEIIVPLPDHPAEGALNGAVPVQPAQW
jgi:hypothetical protein